MELRNAQWLADGRIDCEIDHPQFGWIPFTAAEDDPEVFGRAVFADALNANPAPYVAPPPPTLEEVKAGWRAGASVSKSAFCIAVAKAGIFTLDDAVAAARGDWPASLTPALKGMGAEAQMEAKVTWAAAAVIDRLHPMIAMMQAFLKLTDDQVDAIFGAETQTKD